MEVDCVSVISLTSTTSNKTSSDSESLASILTVSSETQQVPVRSENSKQKNDTIVIFDDTPSHSEKVNDWMKSCDYGSENCVTAETPKQTSTCIRYDFDKSPRAASIPKSCYTRTTPLFSYIEEAKKNNSAKVSTETRAKSVEPHRLNGHSAPKNNILSPSSQKKEFCSYLQLATREDEPHDFFIEHRRSRRVKNQVQSSEKSKIKKKNKVSERDENTVKELETTELGKVFSSKRKNSDKEMPKNYLPLPPKRLFGEFCDFDEAMKDFVDNELKEKEKKELDEVEKENEEETKKYLNGRLKNVGKRRKFKIGLRKFKKVNFISRRLVSLRSGKRLRNLSFDTSVPKKKKKRMRKKPPEDTKAALEGMQTNCNNGNVNKTLLECSSTESAEKSVNVTKSSVNSSSDSPQVEIISIHLDSDDENIDLKNFVDDMLELDKMSEEHRKSVIESRALASSAIANLISKKTPQTDVVQKALKIFSDLSNHRKTLEDEGNNQEVDEKYINEEVEISNEFTTDPHLIISEHDYASYEVEVTAQQVEVCNDEQEEEEEEEEEEDDNESRTSLSPVPIQNREVLPVRQLSQLPSLHRSLTFKRKSILEKRGLRNWTSSLNPEKNLNHSITISNKDGDILRACYQEYNLVIIQQNCISFWTQSALGNVLGAQNMWIPKGQIKRIALNSTYIQKNSMEMVITTETSIAYVELWTKEHKSELREVPVADVFATVYFWRLRQSGLDKKALQLENIKGYADHVQYCVLKCYPRIIVSWYSVQDNEKKKTNIRSYHLAADFQTIANVSDIQPVEHVVSSLHNIEDCDNLIIGCGDNKITLWNIEYGNIVATIEMANISLPLSTLCVKCDRGFLFIIQECVDQELRLIAINGINHSWKKLQSYIPAPGFDCLKGVYIENGILVAYYSQGMLCWNAQTGELIVEEIPHEGEYIPSGKHVIMIVNENIIVRHSLSHLITDL